MRWVIRGVALLIVLVAVVVAARLLRPPQRSDVITEPWDALRGQPWLKPNLRDARVVLPDRPHTRDEAARARAGELEMRRTRTYRLSTNSIRLRGPEVGPKAGRRIVALGDSVTHGWGVAEEEAWPARLAAELARRGTPAEVLNAGVPANDIATMSTWCAAQGVPLAPDLVLWTRRPTGEPGAVERYAEHVGRCADAVRVPVVVILPPVSRFDPRGSAHYREEASALTERLAGRGIPVFDLTDTFREAQAGRGETLERRGADYAVVDQESGKVWLTAPAPADGLPDEVYALFEREPDVREALLFDEGHPDAEGFALFARAVADRIASL